MPLYQIDNKKLTLIENTTFEKEKLRERQDLQKLIQTKIEIISPDTLIIAEEYGNFSESRRRIDLLGIDQNANLVVIELKRDEDGGHAELQAIRYASMVANLTWENAVSAYQNHLNNQGITDKAEEKILDFLGWDEADEELFAQDVRIILAARNFSKEITTSVLWLNEQALDITCVRLTPIRIDDRLLINAEQIIPLPEAEAYQIEVRQKKLEEKVARESAKDRSLLSIFINGTPFKTSFRKADIGYYTIKALKEHDLINDNNFEILLSNKSCSFPLLRKFEDITDTNWKYRKYRTENGPELIYNNDEYYVARNWSKSNSSTFIEIIEKTFPNISYEWS